MLDRVFPMIIVFYGCFELGPLQWGLRALIARPWCLSLICYCFTCGVLGSFWYILVISCEERLVLWFLVIYVWLEKLASIFSVIYGSLFDFTFYFVYLALMLYITRLSYLSLFRDHILVLFFYLKYLSSHVGALRKLVWKRWGSNQEHCGVVCACYPQGYLKLIGIVWMRVLNTSDLIFWLFLLKMLYLL